MADAIPEVPMAGAKVPLKLILVPLEGPIASLGDGVPVDLEAHEKFLFSRFPRVKEATTPARIGDYQGMPCLYLKDRLVSHPNAEIVRENGSMRIRVAHEDVRNPLFINAEVLKADAGVRDAELSFGDVVQIGTSRFRVERASITAWAELFARAYPDLQYVSVLHESGPTSGRSRHECKSREGYRVDVECRTFPGPVASHFRRSEPMLTRLQQLRAHVDGDPALQKNLPRLYDVRSYESPDGDRHIFLAHEPYRGQTLRAMVLDTGDPMTVRRSLRFGIRLCEAVHRFHAFGLHQQLTPDAVWFKEGDSPDHDRVTLGGLFLGVTGVTAAGASDPDAEESDGFDVVELFRPPEHIDHGEYTERSELYAAALLVSVALTARLPYDAAKRSDLVQRIMTAHPPLPDRCPPKLQAVLEKGWGKRPTQRFRTLLDLKVQLQRLLDELPADAD